VSAVQDVPCMYGSLIVQRHSVMQTVHKAKRHSPECAVSALGLFIAHRLLPDISPGLDPASPPLDRLEKAVVTYVLFATTCNELAPDKAIVETRNLLDALANHGQTTLSSKATHAAQTLIWKAAGNSGSEASEAAEGWYRTLWHPVFDNAGQMNKAKIARWVINRLRCV